MKYYVKCYECGRVFRINVQKYGVSRYRCPDCGNVVPFLLTDQGPVVQAMPIKPSVQRKEKAKAQNIDIATARNTDITTSRHNDITTNDNHESETKKRKGFWRRLWGAFMWLFGIIARFLRWVAKKIRTFREKYEDADLWLFFGFSFLFVVGVIVGLWLMAQITILLSDVNSWFFQMFLKLKFML